MMCAIHCGRPSGRPAMPAPATAIIAPEINPPGNSAHRNSRPPALPMTSVSSTLRISARLGRAGRCMSLPYGKCRGRGQMRGGTAAMRADVERSVQAPAESRYGRIWERVLPRPAPELSHHPRFRRSGDSRRPGQASTDRERVHWHWHRPLRFDGARARQDVPTKGPRVGKSGLPSANRTRPALRVATRCWRSRFLFRIPVRSVFEPEVRRSLPTPTSAYPPGSPI